MIKFINIAKLNNRKGQPMDASAGAEINSLASVPVLFFVVCFFLGKSRTKDITKAGAAV
jgi:hypothetical protein